MKCDMCREREAVVFVHQVANSGKTELRLCARCAKDHGVHALDGNIAESLGKLLAALPAKGNGGKPTVPSSAAACSRCGISLGDIKKRRTAGCPKCWEHFPEQLLEGGAGLIKGPSADVAGRRHKGRLSIRAERAAAAERERTLLSVQLEAAVSAEAYEEAAALRDALRRLDSKDAGNA